MIKNQTINLTNEELCRLIQEKDSNDARTLLIKQNEGLINMFCYRYEKLLNNTLEVCDLFQVGALGLLEAANRFNLKKNNKFTTYASFYIKKYILDEIYNNGFNIRIPSNRMEKISYYNMHPEIESDEASSYLKDKDTYLSCYSLDKKIDEGEYTFLDNVSTNDISLEVEIERDNLNSSIKLLVDGLDSFENQVISYKYGLNNNECLNVSEISRTLNTTRDKVYSAEKRALEKLKVLSEEKGLYAYLD